MVRKARLSIHLLVMLIVLVPIIAVSAALLAVSRYTTNRIESQLGTALVHSTGSRVRDHLRSNMMIAERVSDLYAHRVQNGTLPIDPDSTWQTLMYESMLIRPSVGSITYATPGGKAVYVMRMGEAYVVGNSQGAGEGQTVEQQLNLRGELVNPPLRRYQYVATERPWYLHALKHDMPVWTYVYFWFSDAPAAMYGQRVAGISYVRQIHDKNGAIAGVMSVDIKLESLSSILRDTEVSQFGSLMVVDQHNNLLADSFLKPGTLQNELKDVRQIAHPAATAAVAALEHRADADASDMTNVDGNLVYTQVLQPSQSLQWYLITILPETNLTGTYVPRQGRAAIESVLIIAVAALLGWYFSRRLSRPVAELAHHVKLIGEGRFDHDIHLRTTTEFEQLSNAVNDMTRNVQEQVRLRAEKEAIQRASDAKNAFFSRVTHDLRTPLNAIIGYTEMLDELQSIRQDKTAREDLRRIMQASRQLLHLINDLLDLAKTEAGGIQLHLENVDVDRLLREVEDIGGPLAVRNGNELVVVNDEPSLRLRTDPQRLRQILLNLVSNSAKFTHNGRIELRVRCDSAHIAFLVRDDGAGIAKDQIPRMFEPFAQASMTSEGTGLGLAICRQLVELLGGEIELISDTGAGTLAQVSFPVSGVVRPPAETVAKTSVGDAVTR